MRRTIIILIILSAIFLIVSTFLFGYRQYFSINSEIDSSRFYEYGQFTSGILGLVLAGFSIYLIYLTFLNQTNQLENSRNQLKSVQDNYDLDVINTIYDQILQDIHDITYIKRNNKNDYVKFQGYDSFYYWSEDTRTNPNSVLNHLVFVLNSIENYLSRVKDCISPNNPIYDILLSRVYLMFHSKVLWPVLEKIYSSQKVKNHTDAEIIFTKFDNLIVEAYKYLLAKKMLNKPDHPRIIELLKI